MFEAPDENYHYAFIQRLAQSWELPVQDPQTLTPWYQEGSQPPLYYWLASLIVRAVNPPFAPYPLAINPHAAIGLGLARDNNNFFVHTRTEAFPWRGHVLALRLVRVFSILLGAWTVWCLYQTARLVGEALTDKPSEGLAVFAMSFAAFNPQFLFMTSSANNDNLVTAGAATALWLMLCLLRRDWSWRIVTLLSVVLALTALSKLSGLTLYVVALALVAMLWWRRTITLRQALISGVVIGGGFALLAGWWYLRNWQLYGDPTGLNTMIAIIAPRPTPYTLGVLLDEMTGFRISFWALFGWFNVIGPGWFYHLMDIVTALALVGGVARLVRAMTNDVRSVGTGHALSADAADARAPVLLSPLSSLPAERGRGIGVLHPLGLLGLQLVLMFVSLINWTRLTPGTQGRLLFPALPAICVLLAYGLTALRPRWRKVSLLPAVIVLVMVGTAAVIPVAVIAPTYAPPPTVSALPPAATPINVQFGAIRALGYHIAPEPVYPGGLLPVTVYYQGYPTPRPLSLYLTVLDRAGRVIGKIDGYPGGGNLTTTDLDPGAIYADSYLIPIASDADAPMQFRVEFGWWDFRTQQREQPLDNGERPLDALILRGGTLLSPVRPAPAVPHAATFGGALRLNGYGLDRADGTYQRGDSIRVLLNWEALGRVGEDFNVFVHLVRPEAAAALAQGDDAPRGGAYPTSAWAVSAPFDAPFSIPTAAVPAGEYRISVGLYRLSDFSRLPTESGGDSLILSTPITLE
jgi:hypothetical protein